MSWTIGPHVLADKNWRWQVIVDPSDEEMLKVATDWTSSAIAEKRRDFLLREYPYFSETVELQTEPREEKKRKHETKFVPRYRVAVHLTDWQAMANTMEELNDLDLASGPPEVDNEEEWTRIDDEGEPSEAGSRVVSRWMSPTEAAQLSRDLERKYELFWEAISSEKRKQPKSIKTAKRVKIEAPEKKQERVVIDLEEWEKEAESLGELIDKWESDSDYNIPDLGERIKKLLVERLEEEKEASQESRLAEMLTAALPWEERAKYRSPGRGRTRKFYPRRVKRMTNYHSVTDMDTKETFWNKFPVKLFCVLSIPDLHPVLRWNKNGDGFVIVDVPTLTKDVLPRHFRCTQFSVFVRQLVSHGFTANKARKKNSDPQEWAHPMFRRGEVAFLDEVKPNLPTTISVETNMASTPDSRTRLPSEDKERGYNRQKAERKSAVRKRKRRKVSQLEHSNCTSTTKSSSEESKDELLPVVVRPVTTGVYPPQPPGPVQVVETSTRPTAWMPLSPLFFGLPMPFSTTPISLPDANPVSLSAQRVPDGGVGSLGAVLPISPLLGFPTSQCVNNLVPDAALLVISNPPKLTE